MAILLVDDSDTMRMLLRRELRIAGWDDVVEASDAPTALALIESERVDLVLADWNMPGMGGLELLRQLRTRSVPPKLGFVTCEARPKARTRALAAGAEFLLTKPVDPETLDLNIRAALGFAVTEDGTDGPQRRTMQNVLSRLLQRDVSVTDSDNPSRSDARCEVCYQSDSPGGGGVSLVANMALAAALACAFARIPPGQALEWSGAHSLPDALERNFIEVTNMLVPLLEASDVRYIYDSIWYPSEGVRIESLDGTNQWGYSAQIEIRGYPAGRLGLLR